MTEQEAIGALEEHKKLIDKKYLKTRNSKAIEVVLNAIKEKDKIINLMADYISDIDDEMFCDDEEKYDGEIFIGCDEDCQKCVIKYLKTKQRMMKNETYNKF